MFISIYKNSTDTIGVEADHLKILGGIKSGRWNVEIENLRSLLQSERDADYAQSKRQLPAATFGGSFSKREAASITRSSGLIILDIDKLSQAQINKYSGAFSEDKYIYSYFVSPSGSGLKILVK